MKSRIATIVANYATGEFSYNSALYMLEALMASDVAEKLLRGVK